MDGLYNIDIATASSLLGLRQKKSKSIFKTRTRRIQKVKLGQRRGVTLGKKLKIKI